MDQRITAITLGVADTGRARALYERLGWSGRSPDGDVVYFQAGGMVLALWGPTDWPRTARWTAPRGGAG